MKLQALQYMRYAGKPVHAGDVFEANAADVRVLVALGRAKKHLEEPAPARGQYLRRDMVPQAAAVMTAAAQPLVSSPFAPVDLARPQASLLTPKDLAAQRAIDAQAPWSGGHLTPQDEAVLRDLDAKAAAARGATQTPSGSEGASAPAGAAGDATPSSPAAALQAPPHIPGRRVPKASS